MSVVSPNKAKHGPEKNSEFGHFSRSAHPYSNVVNKCKGTALLKPATLLKATLLHACFSRF